MPEIAPSVPSPPVATRPFRLKRRANERVRLLGERMDLVRHEEVFHFVAARLNRGVSSIIANHNLHSLYLVRRNARIRAFFDSADLVEVDSTPLLAWARVIGRNSRQFHRCTYLDWRDFFWARARQENWRVFFVGGAPGVADAARERILADHPGVELATHHGYFDARCGSAENTAVVEAINAFKPHILLVGMGMPRQEIWVLENHKAITHPCAHFTVGGAFDYEAGVQKAAPRWMGRLGVEWLFRLLADPRRLFSRYCIEPWFLIGPALGDLRQAFLTRSDTRIDGATAFPG
ncbi:WecB/TagA/CpsF family glycosyltransferase [Caulobacter henricii]|uniref:Glycosyl transferase n=1 Tax=Caulobacter henricii TaxID=69395 RepID=A0A0N7JI08_9CAUL|nr:WecB/TagA/CpsF family glycosyltransferase [Caulobacter henricii]ALL14874.1 glycosyl transferase [Caulobacter henricii]